VQATLPNQMHAQLTELNGLKGNVGKRCIIMGLISSQVWHPLCASQWCMCQDSLVHPCCNAGLVSAMP
jgi:hypothetical protein